jgi:phosphatidate cytidylyltransferase
MAFNWKTFRTRALTAILFVIVMLTGLFFNIWSFLLLFSIIYFGCWWEYLRIMEKIHKAKFHPYVKLGMMVLGYGFMLWFCGPDYRLSTYGLKENISLPVSLAGFVLLILGIFQKTKINLRSFGGAAAGLLYISLSWGLLIDMRSGERFYPLTLIEFIESKQTAIFQLWGAIFIITKNFLVCFTIILTMWINDTMAYIVGSLIGKTPLTKISPKKTWEGTIGGIILAVIVIGLAFSTLDQSIFGESRNGHFRLPAYFWYILAAIASIAGTFGDILESKLKRMANIKDSGQIMPGHGGFMDRFDSLLIAIPFCWLYAVYGLH